MDFALKVINHDQNTIIRLQLWDIAGQVSLWKISDWITSPKSYKPGKKWPLNNVARQVWKEAYGFRLEKKFGCITFIKMGLSFKGQSISEWLFGLLNFPKNQRKN